MSPRWTPKVRKGFSSHKVSCAFIRDEGFLEGGEGVVTALDLCVFKTVENMTETHSFLQSKPLPSPYSDVCFQVQSEAAFMRKIMQALPPIDVGGKSLCISFLSGKMGIITVPTF